MFSSIGALLILGGVVLTLRGASEVNRNPFRRSRPGAAVRMAQAIVVVATVVVLTYVFSWKSEEGVPAADDSYVSIKGHGLSTSTDPLA